ncbi:MAG: hypothetical protein ACK55T_06590 [Bacteroidota bacterium]
MKNLKSIFLFLLFVSIQSSAQIKALTDDGREVILYKNGTWKFLNADQAKQDSIRVGGKTYTKTPSQTFLVKSKVADVGIYINPQDWKFKLGTSSGENEYSFNFKNDLAFAFLITEKLQFDYEALRNVALSNARNAGPDLREVLAEFRTVNGRKVLCLKFQCTVQEIPFTYMGYYYSSATGTAQLLAASTQQQFPEIESKIEEFLNGMVPIQK